MIRAYFTKYLDLQGWKIKVITIKNPSGYFIKYAKDESLLKQVSSRIQVYAIKTFNWWFLGEVLYTLGFIPCVHLNWAVSTICRLGNIIEGKGIVLATFPSFSSLLIGCFIKKRYGYPLVADFRDEYYGVGSSMNPIAKMMDRKYERLFVQSADSITTATQGIKDHLVERHNLDDNKVHVIYNGYGDEPVERSKEAASSKFGIIYAGAIAQHQKPEVLSLAYRKLVQERPELRHKIEVDVYGPANHYYKSVFRKTMTEGINYRGFIPHAEVLGEILNADVGFFSLASDVYSYAAPTKLFEYIKLEKPILAALPDGEAKRIIEQYDIGKVSHYSDIDGLARNMYELYVNSQECERLRQNIAKVKPLFSIEHQVKKLSALLETL